MPWPPSHTIYEPHREKTCFDICEQQRCRSACASAQSDQHLCFSLPRYYNTSSFYIRNFKHLPGFCGCAGPFESYLVADPEDRFSRDEADIMPCLPGHTIHHSLPARPYHIPCHARQAIPYTMPNPMPYLHVHTIYHAMPVRPYYTMRCTQDHTISHARPYHNTMRCPPGHTIHHAMPGHTIYHNILARRNHIVYHPRKAITYHITCHAR